MTEMQSKKELIDALNSEGGELKAKASSEDQRMVDRMLGDVRKRYEDLDFMLEEKKVSHSIGHNKSDGEIHNRSLVPVCTDSSSLQFLYCLRTRAYLLRQN